jgi:hypothetical protein
MKNPAIAPSGHRPPPPRDAFDAFVQRILTHTPDHLKMLLVCIMVLSGVCFFTSHAAYNDLRETIQSMAHDTAPSIIAAEHIRADLGDANADVTNLFLAAEEEHAEIWKGYQASMGRVHANLLAAAQNITFKNEEPAPILTIMRELGNYERLVGQANANRTGNFRKDLEEANELMNIRLLPAATALDEINLKHLNERWNGHHKSFLGSKMLLLCAALLMAVLLYAQFFLLRRMRRIINPGLAFASVTLFLFCGYATISLHHAEGRLARAKTDAFDSVHALWQARALAYRSNAEESLYLLDYGNPEKQAVRTMVFKANALLMLDKSKPSKLAKPNTQSQSGFIGDALANVTYSGEKELVLQMQEYWESYVNIDSRMRELEADNKHQDAIKLNLGKAIGQSNWAFDKFDKALDGALALNQAEFDKETQHEGASLQRYNLLQWAMLILVILGSIGGLKPRIDEYRFDHE